MGLAKSAESCDDVKCRRNGWEWDDATTYDPDVWHGWFKGSQWGSEPLKNQDCAWIGKGYGWIGYWCTSSNKMTYICEKGSFGESNVAL